MLGQCADVDLLSYFLDAKLKHCLSNETRKKVFTRLPKSEHLEVMD